MKAIPENLIPLFYLALGAIIAGVLYHFEVPEPVIGGLVGACITRVKISVSKGQ